MVMVDSWFFIQSKYCKHIYRATILNILPRVKVTHLLVLYMSVLLSSEGKTELLDFYGDFFTCTHYQPTE